VYQKLGLAKLPVLGLLLLGVGLSGFLNYQMSESRNFVILSVTYYRQNALELSYKMFGVLKHY
jgi:hypothetical protein